MGDGDVGCWLGIWKGVEGGDGWGIASLFVHDEQRRDGCEVDHEERGLRM